MGHEGQIKLPHRWHNRLESGSGMSKAENTLLRRCSELPTLMDHPIWQACQDHQTDIIIGLNVPIAPYEPFTCISFTSIQII